MTRTATIDLGELGLSPDVGLDAAAKFFRGLGDPTRLRLLLLLLEHGELSVGELVQELGSAQGRISSHLACLRWCGYVQSRNEGRYVYYSIPDPRTRRLLRLALEMVADNEEHILTCHRIGDTEPVTR